MKDKFEIWNYHRDDNPIGYIYIDKADENVEVMITFDGAGGQISGGNKVIEQFAVNILKKLKSDKLK